MELKKLLEIEESKRDNTWEKDFLDIFPQEHFSLLYPDAKPGPDNWPYLWISSILDDKKAEPAKDLINWLGSRGIGMVLNPQKTIPDYVFTYGMLWYYREFGLFFEKETDHIPTDQANFETLSSELSYGYPSESYIPKYVRDILREFFLQQGVLKPKWILLTKDKQDFDLCFSLEALKTPPEKEHQGVLEAISWFLPNHFRLALVSENGLPKFETI